MKQRPKINQWICSILDTDDYIFELDIFPDPAPARLTLKGVEHLVQCLKEGKQSVSSGEQARHTLAEVLRFKKQYELEEEK